MILQIGSSEYLYNELKKNNKVMRFSRSSENYFDLNNQETWEKLEGFSKKYNKICIAAGILYKKNIIDQSKEEIIDSFYTNCISVVLLCEKLLRINSDVRIVIISSESSLKGSFDETYFLSKSAINRYVEERLVGCNQQLVCISPSTIEDSNMTKMRDDKERLLEYKNKHPKKRFLQMKEVADLVTFLFNDSSKYISNENININGGKFARMNNIQ